MDGTQRQPESPPCICAHGTALQRGAARKQFIYPLTNTSRQKTDQHKHTSCAAARHRCPPRAFAVWRCRGEADACLSVVRSYMTTTTSPMHVAKFARLAGHACRNSSRAYVRRGDEYAIHLCVQSLLHKYSRHKCA